MVLYPNLLNESNYSKKLGLNGDLARKNVVVMFFREGCGHCDNLKPTFIEAGKSDPNAIYALVDTANTPALMDKVNSSARHPKYPDRRLSPFTIQGVPLVVSYAANKGGRFYSKFGGQRTEEDLHAYSAGIGTAPITFV